MNTAIMIVASTIATTSIDSVRRPRMKKARNTTVRNMFCFFMILGLGLIVSTAESNC